MVNVSSREMRFVGQKCLNFFWDFDKGLLRLKYWRHFDTFQVFDAYAQFEESMIKSKMEEATEQVADEDGKKFSYSF